MAVMEKCCCCSVKTGSLVLGSLMLIGSILAVGRDAKDVMAGSPDISYSDLELVVDQLGMSVEQMQTFVSTSHYTTIADLFLSLAMIIFSSLLLYGVNKGVAKYVKPILVFLPVDFVVRFIFVCIHSINLGFFHPLSIALNIVCCIGMVFDIFIWLCFYSHYQQLCDRSDGHYGNEMKPL